MKLLHWRGGILVWGKQTFWIEQQNGPHLNWSYFHPPRKLELSQNFWALAHKMQTGILLKFFRKTHGSSTKFEVLGDRVWIIQNTGWRYTLGPIFGWAELKGQKLTISNFKSNDSPWQISLQTIWNHLKKLPNANIRGTFSSTKLTKITKIAHFSHFYLVTGLTKWLLQNFKHENLLLVLLKICL